MSDPVGFLITWTCYGTWLFGDYRGSVDDDHNAYGTPTLRVDERRSAGLRRRLIAPPFRLTKEARVLVAKTIEEHCRRREWELLGLNVRSNHVHVVVRFAGISPEKMMGEWKSWCTRGLRKEGLAGAESRVWTRHGSTRYVWKESDFDSAVAYVMEGQGTYRFGAT